MKKEVTKVNSNSEVKISRLPSCAACFLNHNPEDSGNAVAQASKAIFGKARQAVGAIGLQKSSTGSVNKEPCKYCITAEKASSSHLHSKFRRCQKGHDKHIPKAKIGGFKALFNRTYAPQHAHDKSWCTKALLKKSAEEQA